MYRNVKFGGRVHLTEGEDYSEIIDRSRFFEQHGYDAVLVDDHLLYGTSFALALDPFSTVSSILASTRRIRVGVAVTDTIRRHPAILAQSAGTLTSMAPGRFMLGLGTGDLMNQTPFGLPVDHRFERFKEGVALLKMLWNSNIENPIHFNGRFHTLSNAYLQVGPRPPIYFAAFRPEMLRFAGEEADGWIPHCHTPETYRNDLRRILDSAHRRDRPADAITPSYYTPASVSTNREEADHAVLGPARFFLALAPEALRKIDPSAEHPGRIWEQVRDPREQRKIISGIASKIPVEVALRTVVHGTPSDCIEQISRYMKQGCKEFHLMFTTAHGLWSGDRALPMVELFAEKIVDYFHEGSARV